jgi:transposase
MTASACPKAGKIALLLRASIEGETDVTRTIRASDQSIQSFEGSKVGPALDRRTFLIGAGVAAGQGFPVSAMAQSTIVPSSPGVHRRDVRNVPERNGEGSVGAPKLVSPIQEQRESVVLRSGKPASNVPGASGEHAGHEGDADSTKPQVLGRRHSIQLCRMRPAQPQRRRPIFPVEVTHITNQLAFMKKDGQVTYFKGQTPVFSHDETDIQTFRMITSQFCVSGHVKQRDIIRAFGVTSISVKRWVRTYREKGPKGFYPPRVTRGPAALVEDVVSEIEGRLAGGATPAEIAKELGLKLNTIQKAMREGKIRAPVKKSQLCRPDGTRPDRDGAARDPPLAPPTKLRRSLPRLTHERYSGAGASVLPDGRNLECTCAINDRCWVRTQDGHRVVIAAGMVLAKYALGDHMAESYAMVNLVEQGLANQTDVVRAFGCSTRTVRRHQRRFEDGGLAALGRSPGYPRGRARVAGLGRQLVHNLNLQGHSYREIARRIGVSEKAIRNLVRSL